MHALRAARLAAPAPFHAGPAARAVRVPGPAGLHGPGGPAAQARLVREGMRGGATNRRRRHQALAPGSGSTRAAGGAQGRAAAAGRRLQGWAAGVGLVGACPGQRGWWGAIYGSGWRLPHEAAAGGGAGGCARWRSAGQGRVGWLRASPPSRYRRGRASFWWCVFWWCAFRGEEGSFVHGMSWWGPHCAALCVPGKAITGPLFVLFVVRRSTAKHWTL